MGQNFTRSLGRHLPNPWGQRWKGGEVGELTQRVEVGESKRL